MRGMKRLCVLLLHNGPAPAGPNSLINSLNTLQQSFKLSFSSDLRNSSGEEIWRVEVSTSRPRSDFRRYLSRPTSGRPAVSPTSKEAPS